MNYYLIYILAKNLHFEKTKKPYDANYEYIIYHNKLLY